MRKSLKMAVFSFCMIFCILLGTNNVFAAKIPELSAYIPGGFVVYPDGTGTIVAQLGTPQEGVIGELHPVCETEEELKESTPIATTTSDAEGYFVWKNIKGTVGQSTSFSVVIRKEGVGANYYNRDVTYLKAWPKVNLSLKEDTVTINLGDNFDPKDYVNERTYPWYGEVNEIPYKEDASSKTSGLSIVNNVKTDTEGTYKVEYKADLYLPQTEFYFNKEIVLSSSESKTLTVIVKDPNKEYTATVKYVDEETGKEIRESQPIKGKAGETYDATTKDYKLEKIDGYVLNTDKLPENAKGTFEDKDITITYLYKKDGTIPTEDEAKVVVKYVDEDGKSIIDDVILKGKVGEDYKSEKKKIKGYTFKEVKGKEEGKFTKDSQEVVYVYTKNATDKGLPKTGTKVVIPAIAAIGIIAVGAYLLLSKNKKNDDK
ncbi:MucBP domain-containing protein [Miniphocaeibacter massiliensis]|uniref:MucBP domain-containing protein n=1 Tax=Miniphocaeibacter massiliensis TaxID=2041841 RepID=UPI000C1C6835|nr:MucBP domain-containing protein [Miniphocaeibacter massiliensis]